MNLHGIVSSSIATVNPFIMARLKRSVDRTTTAPDGTRTPIYKLYRGRIQVQGTNPKDREYVLSQNQQEVLRTVYLLGNWAGIIRTDKTGGDVMIFAEDGKTYSWKVITVKDKWPDWTSVIVAQQ
jgi:hypothetical protein